MNITSSSGLTIYNVTQLGTAGGTGVTTMFEISPNYGFFIAASQFTVTNLEDYPEVAGITFSDSSSANTPGNVVNVVVTWNGTTDITEDYFLNLNISVDDASIYDSNTTLIDFYLVENYDVNIGNGTVTLSVSEVNDGSLVPNDLVITPGSGTYRFQGWVGSSNTVAVADVTISVTEGVRYINSSSETENLFFNQFIDQPDTSQGQFSFEYLSKTLDSFGLPKTVTYRIFFTRAEFAQEDIGTQIEYSTVGVTNYYANFVYDTVTLTEAAGNEYNLIFNTNIPFYSNTFSLSFSATWAETGDTSPSIDGLQVSYPIDYSVIPDGTAIRYNTVTLKDIYYPTITRDTVTLQQVEDAYVNLTIQLNPPGEYTSSDSPASFQYGSSAKVISYNNGNDPIYENVFLANSPGNNVNVYDDPYTSSTQYYLRAEVNETITLEMLNNGTVGFEVTQDQYPIDAFPGKDWCDFSTTQWYESSPGVYKRGFYIRNQDAVNFLGTHVDTTDRTATFTLTHPLGTASSSVTLTQDDRYTISEAGGSVKIVEYDSGIFAPSEDSQFSSVGYSNASDPGNVNFTATATSGFGTTQYKVRIKFDNLDFDFNLYNNVTTSQDAPTFKQYPTPSYAGQPSGQLIPNDSPGGPPYYVDFDDDSFFTNYTQELIYNENYDASNPDEDHHYTFVFTLKNNDTYSNRHVTWNFTHPKNEAAGPLSVNYDGTTATDVSFKILQPAFDQLDANINDPDSGQPLGIYSQSYPYVISSEAQTVTISLAYSGTTLPTIGLYSDAGVYTPLAQSTVVNGISYVVNNDAQIVEGGTTRTITVTLTGNTDSEDRENTLGFWHANSTAAIDSPNDAIKITQEGVEFDEVDHDIILYTTQPYEQSTGGNTITLLVKVLNYTAENYANSVANTDNSLDPVVEVYRWNGPNVQDGIYYDTEGNYDNGTLTSPTVLSVTANPLYNSSGPLSTFGGVQVSYTHTVQVSYTENNLDQNVYYAVRARHFYNNTFDEDDYVIFTIPSQSVIEFTGVTKDNSPQDIMGLVNNYKFCNLSSGTDLLKIDIKVNNYEYNISDNDDFPSFVANYSPYFVLRFLNASYLDSSGNVVSGSEKVWKNPDTPTYSLLNPPYSDPAKHLPITFFDINGENSEWVAEAPTAIPTSIGSISNPVDFINNIEIQPATYPDKKFSVLLNVSGQSTGGVVNSFIGVWSYDSMPFTNIYDLSQPFQFTNANNGTQPYANTISKPTNSNIAGFQTSFHNHMVENPQQWQGSTEGYSTSNLYGLFGLINDKLLQINSSYDGWDWNRGDTTFDAEGNHITMAYINLFSNQSAFGISGANQMSVNGKVVYISFTISNFEYIGDWGVYEEAFSVGLPYFVTNGRYSSAWYDENLLSINAGEMSTLAVQRLQASGANPNGRYFGKIKINELNNITFATKLGCRYTLSDLKIFAADEELKIKPGAGNIFDRAPDDVLKIIHQSTGSSLRFSDAQYLGGCFSPFLATQVNVFGEQHVVSSNSEESTISGWQPSYQVINFENYTGTNPVLKAWDGSNSSSIVQDAMVEFIGFNSAGGNTPSCNIKFENNTTGAQRTLTIGLYNGAPSTSTQAPVDTILITQPSVDLDEVL